MQHDRLERDPSIERRLRALPDEAQPYGFAEFQRRARAGGRRRSAFFGTVPLLPRLAFGLAAVLALAALGLFLVGRLPGLPHGAGTLAAQLPAAAPARSDPDLALAGPEPSQAMETWLTSFPAQPAVVRVGSGAAMASLEDRIALLDDVLSAERAAHAQPARLVAIERQRGQLLRSLVQVRYAEGLAEAR